MASIGPMGSTIDAPWVLVPMDPMVPRGSHGCHGSHWSESWDRENRIRSMNRVAVRDSELRRLGIGSCTPDPLLLQFTWSENHTK